MTDIVKTTEFLFKSILPEPENSEITVSSEEINDVIYIYVSAPESLVGQIIGKNGKIIKSVKTLLNIAHPQVHYQLNIKD
jgi:predicted RNA-binding protein YlqC (UPF0109 family)